MTTINQKSSNSNSHPYFSTYLGWDCGGSSLSRKAQTFLSLATSSCSFGGGGGSKAFQDVLRLAKRQSFYLVLVPPRSLNTLTRKHPGGMLTRCPSHDILLFSTWRCSGSLCLSQMTELLTLSIAIPATLRRKLISVTCICDLVISVTTQTS